MKAAFYTLGCKVNQYETRSMRETLENAGYEIVDCNNEADFYIINSCTVTGTSDQKTRQMVRRFKRLHPDSTVILTGCMPQAYPDDAEKLTEADIVLGNRSNELLLNSIDEYNLTGKRLFRVTQHQTGDKYHGNGVSTFAERTRAFVKIQDGCNRFCTYCIIPTARGRVRSRPLDDCKQEFERLRDAGYLEIVLVGINLSSYGSDLGISFCDVVELACSIPGIQRVRLGSLEPDHLTAEVVERLSHLDKLCPQFHISLQSGCNSTLKRMNRHYTAEEYYDLCESLRRHFTEATITTDVMVGFPGETDEEFNESLNFVKKIGFEKVHVFPYSPRTGTPAAKRPQLSKAEKEKRAHKMISATDDIRKNYLNSQIGKTVEVLLERKVSDGLMEGHTSNYLPVHVEADESLGGTLQKVLITDCKDDECIGKLIK